MIDLLEVFNACISRAAERSSDLGTSRTAGLQVCVLMVYQKNPLIYNPQICYYPFNTLLQKDFPCFSLLLVKKDTSHNE